jgi:DNA-binding SARP family transcriptional activator
MLKVHLLGQFDVRVGQESVEIPSRPAQSLLAYLVLSAGTAHRREKLAGLLWPDANEENARSNLRHALWRLRKAIGSEHLDADKISISFNRESEYWLDAALMERGDGAQASSEELLQIVSSYGGELLPGFYDDWVILERERFRSLFEGKIQSLLDRLVEEGNWALVLEWGERWLALGQVPEPAYRALMIAYSGLGDSAGMAAVYKRCINALRNELSVEPSDETKALYEQLKEGGSPVSALRVKVAPPPIDSVSAVHSLLDQWRSQGVEVLDLASLAIVQASLGELPVGDEDAALLIRSALHHAVEVEPWLQRAKSDDVAVGALMEVYDTYPKPQVRGRIVEALKSLESDVAGQATLRIAIEDDAPNVRSEAAVSAAIRGKITEVVDKLLEDINIQDSASGFSAFVAVADEVGLPKDVGNYPTFRVGFELVQRRWKEFRGLILRQTGWIGLITGLNIALYGAFIPLFAAIARPDIYQESLDTFTLPAWILSGAVAQFIVGAVLGLTTSFAVGLADGLWKLKAGRWRYVFGGIAGLSYSGYLISFSLIGLLSPNADPVIYIPVNLLYGLILGILMANVIPKLGTTSFSRKPMLRAVYSALIGSLLTVPYTFVIYLDQAGVTLLSRIIFAAMLPFGPALAAGWLRRQNREGHLT